MFQIRNGVFETNSSSTHSICITKDPHAKLPGAIHFHVGCFGWEEDEVNPANYLYTGIMLAGSVEESAELLDKLKSHLDRWGVTYRFWEVPMRWNPSSRWLNGPHPDFNYCEIDHYHEFRPLIDLLLDNENLLRRYLSEGSIIYTGNDNLGSDGENPPKCYAHRPFFDVDVQTDTGEWNTKEVVNPWHDEEKYQYFLKGN